MHRPITRADIMPMDAYARERNARRARMRDIKKNRRVAVGPDAAFYFENFDTMLHQIHEMLHIEQGGDGQIDDELAAYNPLIPRGGELVATLMFEIDDPVRRLATLLTLGDVEQTVRIAVDEDRISARPEDDVARKTPDGKTSSIHFLHFPFTAEQCARFSDPDSVVTLAIDHPNYAHAATLSPAHKQALAADFKHHESNNSPG